jgi:bifunctional DNA-binding transcriptional regulator/antitoxin component of YhaV-PrlF toxin-antitoxin module
MFTMSETFSVQVNQRGLVTIPKELRDIYAIKTGDQMTLLDLGGVFVLSPRRSEIDQLSNEIRTTLEAKGESLESMLQALREAREQYEA